MGQNVKRRAKRREVKARVLHHVLTSDYSVAELAEQYDVSVRTLYRWIKEDAAKPARRKGAHKRGRMTKADYKDKTIAELEKKAPDLQAALSEKVLENCALQAIVNVTERKYGISAKKRLVRCCHRVSSSRERKRNSGEHAGDLRLVRSQQTELLPAPEAASSTPGGGG